MKYGPEVRTEALRLYPEYGPKETARRVGAPIGTVHDWAKSAGVKGPRLQATAKERAEGIALAREVGITEAARQLGRGRQTIVDWVNRVGVTPVMPTITRTDFAPRLPKACEGLSIENFDLFFPEPGGRTDAAAAQKICRSCVVMEGCLRHALTNDERYGVWGGCTETQRRTLANRWDGTSPLVTICAECEDSFVPLLDGRTERCPKCRSKNSRAA